MRSALKAVALIRKEASAEVERLIALLDRIGPDPDLEENGDNDADVSEHEPSLGSVDNFLNQTKWAAGGGNDTEHTIDREGDEHDGRESDTDEPSLGSVDNNIDQRSWALGMDDDREHEHDGKEPSLGAPISSINDQTKWAVGRTDREEEFDREEDFAR